MNIQNALLLLRSLSDHVSAVSIMIDEARKVGKTEIPDEAFAALVAGDDDLRNKLVAAIDSLTGTKPAATGKKLPPAR